MHARCGGRGGEGGDTDSSQEFTVWKWQGGGETDTKHIEK